MKNNDQEVDDQMNCPTRMDLQKINEQLAVQKKSESKLREKAESICQLLTDENQQLRKHLKMLWAIIVMLVCVVVLLAINLFGGA